jgi:hypothetical protein
MSDFKFDVGQHVNATLYVGKVISRTTKGDENEYVVCSDDGIHSNYFECDLELDEIDHKSLLLLKFKTLWEQNPTLSFSNIFLKIIGEKIESPFMIQYKDLCINDVDLENALDDQLFKGQEKS